MLTSRHWSPEQCFKNLSRIIVRADLGGDDRAKQSLELFTWCWITRCSTIGGFLTAPHGRLWLNLMLLTVQLQTDIIYHRHHHHHHRSSGPWLIPGYMGFTTHATMIFSSARMQHEPGKPARTLSNLSSFDAQQQHVLWQGLVVYLFPCRLQMSACVLRISYTCMRHTYMYIQVSRSFKPAFWIYAWSIQVIGYGSNVPSLRRFLLKIIHTKD